MAWNKQRRQFISKNSNQCIHPELLTGTLTQPLWQTPFCDPPHHPSSPTPGSHIQAENSGIAKKFRRLPLFRYLLGRRRVNPPSQPLLSSAGVATPLAGVATPLAGGRQQSSQAKPKGRCETPRPDQGATLQQPNLTPPPVSLVGGRTVRCAKSRLFSTTGSHGLQGSEFCTACCFELIMHASVRGWFSGVLSG